MKDKIANDFCENDVKALGETIDKFEKASDEDKTLHLDLVKYPYYSDFTIELYQEDHKRETKVQYIPEGGDYASNFIYWLNSIAEQKDHGETLYARLFQKTPAKTQARTESLKNLFDKLG